MHLGSDSNDRGNESDTLVRAQIRARQRERGGGTGNRNEHGRGVLPGVVEGEAGKGTFASDDGGYGGGELGHVGVGYHAADVVAYEMDWFGDAEVLNYELV